MEYTGVSNGRFLGYLSYNCGECIECNYSYTDSAYLYRDVNNIIYVEDCKAWYSIKCNCSTCKQFDEIIKETFKKDKKLENIIKSEFDNNHIIIRDPIPTMSFPFSVNHLKLDSKRFD